MSSNAKCSFCSGIDRSVHVICEGMCLVCTGCQKSSGIKQVLSRCLDAIDINGHVLCPICEEPMAPNMINDIKSFYISANSDSNTIDASHSMFEQPNILVKYKKIKKLPRQLSNIATEVTQKVALQDDSIDFEASLSSSEVQSSVEAAIVEEFIPAFKKVQLAKEAKAQETSKNIKIKAIINAPFTETNALELIDEVYVEVCNDQFSFNLYTYV
jgi:hypothetical protein